MPAALAVDRSTLRLSEVARHVVIPEGIVDTLWFEVEERCREFGVEFDTWQDGLGQVVLGLREDGLFAATVGGITLSIPRQVAKTFMVMMIVIALCTLHPNLTVIWTAHRTRTATNTFQKMKAMVLRAGVRGYLKPGANQGTAIRDTNGEQEIPFKNGSRVLFGAREQGFGRGFDEVDVEVFDEAQILSIKALEDMVAATNQSRFVHGALLFYMGTPPRPTDPGEVFLSRRAEALAAKGAAGDFGEPVAAGDALYVECSADPDVGQPGGPDLDDPRQVEKANPSYPHRTPPVSVARLRKNLPDEASWRREGLGVWDQVSASSRLITESQWSAVGVTEAPADGIPCFGVAFSADGSRVSLGAALKRDVPHVELVDAARGLDLDMAGGVGPLADWLAEPERVKRTALIVMSGRDGSPALYEALRARGVPKRMLHVASTTDYFAACSMFHDAVKGRAVTRLESEGQAVLDASVAVSDRKARGQAGSWGWHATTPDGDETPVEAVSVALWAAKTTKRRPGGGGVQIL